VTPARLAPPGVVDQGEVTSMAGPTVPPRSDAVQIAELLDSPEITTLVTELTATRWTGRPGYPIRAMAGMALTKSLYTLPTWTRTVGLVREHDALRAALGCPDPASVPSVHACYRFTAKLRKHKPLLDACVDRVTAALNEQIPELGTTVAIDASDMPAYGNGQRFLYKGGPERKRFSDPDATWGHRSAVSTRSGGGFYGYKLHQVVCAKLGLPLAWRVETAKDQESTFAVPLLASVRERGFRAEIAVMDMGYDHPPVYTGFEARPTTATPSSPCARPPPSRPASTSPQRASTASGRSREPTPSGRRPSGAARPGSAHPPAGGSRRVGCTPSSRVGRIGGRSSTGCAGRWSGRTAGSSTNGRCYRCGCGASSGSRSTLTLRSSPGSRSRSPRRERCRWPRRRPLP
jgi:hypothetical protein